MELKCFPSTDVMGKEAEKTPEYMRPDRKAHGIIGVDLLSSAQCDDILEVCAKIEPYQFGRCGAITRELPRPLDTALWPIEQFARNINTFFYGYDLDPESGAWLQTYETGNYYEVHTDGSPVQSRKLTAVAFLSHPEDYEGGEIKFYTPPTVWSFKPTRGSVIVFQPWLQHSVEMITHGLRQTINLGIWGPPFK